MNGGNEPDHALAWSETVRHAAAEADALAATLAGEPHASSAAATPATEGERFRIVGTVGEGAMGRVLEAKDRQFGRVVALKEMSSPTASVPALRRFVLESVVTANLEHPGIVPVYERGVRDGMPYYVMRRVRGRTLRAMMAEAHTSEARSKLISVVVQVAHTLGFTHERGVVHRDVKPENVLVGGHGEAIVLDWGLAKLVAVEGSDFVRTSAMPDPGVHATQDGSVLGTPAYLAPEQARGALDEIDARTDVFALGALLYEILSGRPPYTGPTLPAALLAASECRHPRLGSLVRDVPAELLAIVERAMAARRDDRYTTATELAHALERFQAGALVVRESRAIRAASAAVGVALVLLVLAGAFAAVAALPSLREQGPGAYVVVALALFGLGLSAVEWRTQGRHALSPLVIGVAASTAAVGLAYSLAGLLQVASALHTLADDAVRYRAIVARGAFEALGACTTALVLVALQAVAWALVQRAALRRRPSRGGGSLGASLLAGALACSLVASGCGDDDAAAPDAGPTDASSEPDVRTLDAARDDGETPRDSGGDGGDAARVGPDTGVTDGGAPTIAWDPERFPWPMAHHDTRRTGLSPFAGPTRLSLSTPRSYRYRAVGGSSINIQAAVTSEGVYFGTWGSQRRPAGSAVDAWMKSDGSYYGLSLVGSGGEAATLFAPFEPAAVPACYLWPSEPVSSFDEAFCPDPGDYHASFYNGTIEGSTLVDPENGAHYVGRGDGRLYAIDPVEGRVLWAFRTFDPTDPEHPDGGGEVVGGAVMDPRGLVCFASYGIPWPGTADQPRRETQAVYAVRRDGTLAWRYPSSTPSLDNPVLASPALSPDGDTLYVATWFADAAVTGRLLAFDLTLPPDAPDASRLRWSLDLRNPDRPLRPNGWARHVSVGPEGEIYVGGGSAQGFTTIAFVTAVRDEGDHGAFVWTPAFVEPHGSSAADVGHLVTGIAIDERAGSLDVLYVSTGDLKDSNGPGGSLFALDATGRILASFDPAGASPAGVGTLTAPTLDANGTVYVGARGRHDLLVGPDVPTSQWREGVLYAVRLAGDAFEVLSALEIEGQLDWVPPAIGADGGLYFGSSDSFSPIDQTWFAPGEEPSRRSPYFHGVFE
ncbi:MAG: protein kinase [Deltaproteobacteria bacterium]|nr:protein kinase [Deltaproteobacteria bacterium]